jgi:hypothetical protein
MQDWLIFEDSGYLLHRDSPKLLWILGRIWAFLADKDMGELQGASQCASSCQSSLFLSKQLYFSGLSPSGFFMCMSLCLFSTHFVLQMLCIPLCHSVVARHSILANAMMFDQTSPLGRTRFCQCEASTLFQQVSLYKL